MLISFRSRIRQINRLVSACLDEAWGMEQRGSPITVQWSPLAGVPHSTRRTAAQRPARFGCGPHSSAEVREPRAPSVSRPAGGQCPESCSPVSCITRLNTTRSARESAFRGGWLKTRARRAWVGLRAGRAFAQSHKSLRNCQGSIFGLSISRRRMGCQRGGHPGLNPISPCRGFRPVR
jgi:hypothetical protein